MPRTKLQESVSKRKHPPVDKVKGLILERVNAMELTYSDISKDTGLSPDAIGRMMRKPSCEWEFGRLLAVAKATGVDIEELRNAVNY